MGHIKSRKVVGIVFTLCLVGVDGCGGGSSTGSDETGDSGSDAEIGASDAATDSVGDAGKDSANDTNVDAHIDVDTGVDAGTDTDADIDTECENGCLIDSDCFSQSEANPDNPCEICDIDHSVTGWSDNDGASCDDELFCTENDSCLAGDCSENDGSPCDEDEDCLETERRCCVPEVAAYQDCNADGDVASFDDCGNELSVSEDCPDEHGACNAGLCGCDDGWTGDDCSQCLVYVDENDGDDDNDGASWNDALATLQAAIYEAAADGCHVWVAEGSYTPTVRSILGDDRSVTVTLSPGLELYGGFGGFETALEERDTERFHSIINGEIGLDGSADNAYNVVTGADGCVLDGFIITGGNADDATVNGGGLRLIGGDMTVVNCRFDDNESASDGGGIYVEDGDLVISGSGFTDNRSDNGGGVLCRNGSLSVDGSVFVHNSGYGGGLASRSCDCTISNSRFSGNRAEYWAGAASFTAASGSVSPSTSIITNSVFVNNRSDDRGGAIAVFGEGLTIYNSTFTLNRADDSGGGLYIGPDSDVTIANTILWANANPDTGEASQVVISSDTASVSIGTSLVQDDCSSINYATCSGGNRSGEPRFFDARSGDVRLRYDSDAIDRGNDSLAPATDIDGTERYQDPNRTDGSFGYSDMGAHEHDGAPRLIRAFGYGKDLTAVFSKPVTEASSGDAEFTLDNGVAITSSEIDATGYRVSLSSDTVLDEDETYTLTAAGLVDQNDAPLPDGSSATVDVYGSLVVETFDDNLLPAWHFVDDAGANINGPSDWAVVDQVLYQRSNIYGESGDARYGTRMLMQPSPGAWPQWNNYLVSADIESGDNDGLGLVFRHHGENLYYKIDLDSQRSFSRLYEVHANDHRILASTSAVPYLPNAPFKLLVEVHNAEMWVFIDGESVFSFPVIDETTTDGGGNSGIAGLYTWGSGDTGDVAFDNVSVTGN